MIEARALVGRDEELAAATAALSGPDQRGVVLVGTRGVGRTAVLQRLTATMRGRGRSVVSVAATAATAAVPLGALLPLLPTPPDGTEGEAQVRWATRQLLDGSTADVLAIDDAHWLDPASATAVLEAARHGATAVVATVSADDDVPDPITRLWSDEHAVRLDLAALPAATLESWLRTVVGEPADPRDATGLVELADGRPRVLQQLVMAALRTGALVERPEGWHLSGEVPVPPELVDEIERRAARQRGADRDALELIVLAEPVDPDLLDGELLAAAERLERAGLVAAHAVARTLRLQVARRLDGQVLRNGLSPLRRRLLAARLAGLADARPDLVAPRHRARWLLDSGSGVPAEIAAAGVHDALRVGDATLAAALLTTAPEEPIVLLARARYLHHTGRSSEALAVLDAAGEATGARLRAWIELMGRTLTPEAGDPADRGPNRDHIDTATDERPADLGAIDAMVRRRFRDAAASAAAQLDDPATKDDQRVIAVLVLAAAAMAVGDLRAAADRVAQERHRPSATRRANDPGRGRAVANACYAMLLSQLGEIELAMATRALMVLEDIDVRGAFTTAWAAAEIAKRRGDAAEAQRLFLRSIDRLAPGDELVRAWLRQRMEQTDPSTLTGWLRAEALHAADLRAPSAAIASELAELSSTVDGDLVDAWAAAASAAAANDDDALIDAAETCERLGALGDAAATWARASLLRARRGRALAARAAARHARALASRCGDDAGHLVAELPGPPELSEPEVEIAELAALGQSDQQIAAATFRSPRTVAATMRKVMDKLGVPDRSELATAWLEHQRAAH